MIYMYTYLVADVVTDLVAHTLEAREVALQLITK
jgi:hypothetical protein